MKTIAKLLALCMIFGALAFAQDTKPATADASTKTADTDAKPKKAKKAKKAKKDEKKDSTAAPADDKK